MASFIVQGSTAHGASLINVVEILAGSIFGPLTEELA